MLSPLQWWAGPWEKVRGQLHLDLDHIVAAINQRWAITFGDNNLLQAGTIEGDPTSATRYVANTGTKTPHGPKWDFVNLINGVINRLAFKNLAAASTSSVLLGRGSAAGGGDFQEITLGTGLSMTGTVISSTGGGGGSSSASGVAFALVRRHKQRRQPLTAPPGTSKGGGGGGGGGLVLVEEHTAASVASLVFNTGITSTYDTYLIELIDLVPDGDDTFNFDVSTDGGSTWLANIYATVYFRMSKTASSSDGHAAEQVINLSGGALNVSSDATHAGLSGFLKLYNPLSTTWKKITAQISYWYPGTPELLGITIAAAIGNTTPVNALRVTANGAHTFTGTIRLYGEAL